MRIGITQPFIFKACHIPPGGLCRDAEMVFYSLSNHQLLGEKPMEYLEYPFSAIVGQEDMKTALLLNAVNPAIGGVLIQGEKGTAKTTAVRSLPEVLPDGRRVVELPLNATEDRVVGTVNLGNLMKNGEKRFEPGLLADADGNILFVDEVNLLEDHIVDVLLDAAATGCCHVERDGVSYSHHARFILIGTMNPEEGTLRPQLLDRFGLSVTVAGTLDASERAEVIRRRLAYERDQAAFCARWRMEEDELRERLAAAIERLPSVRFSDEMAETCSAMCASLGVDGYRGDLTVMKAACAAAALDGREEVGQDDLLLAARFALPHRMKRRPFEDRQLTPEMIREAAQRNGQEDAPPPEDGTPSPSSGQEDQSGDSPARDVPIGEAAVKLPESGAENSPAAISGRGEKKAGNPTSGRSVGYTADPASGRPHVPGSILTQLNSGESVADGVKEENIRYQKLSGSSGAKLLFIVDTSGSMFANRKLELVKGCVLELLKDAYRSRDQIALIGYGGKHPQLYLSYTSSPELAADQLRHMKSGGGTPLVEALDTAQRFLEQYGASRVLLFSDGRYNRKGIVDPELCIRSFGEYCAFAGIPLHLLDAESGGNASAQSASELASMLRAELIPLADRKEQTMLEAIERARA